MANDKSNDRKALGILSETVTAEFGPGATVSKEIRRAFTSGREIDRFTARAAFDALQGAERGRIANKANRLATAYVQTQQPPKTEKPWKGPRSLDIRGTGRDWASMDTRQPRSRGRAKPSGPPSFLRPVSND